MKSFPIFLGLTAVAAISVPTTSEATLLVDVNFDSGVNGSNVGVGSFTSDPEAVSTAGLEGAGALSIENAARITASFDGGVVSQLGVDGTSIYGRYLVNNPTTAGGFTGIELDQGSFDTNRVMVLGEAPSNTPGTQDFAVIDPDGGGVGTDTNAGDPGDGVDLALPTVVAQATREIFFRIDYANAGDRFNLINADGSVISFADSTDLTFSRIGFAAFGGAEAIIYDEFELGTTLQSVGGVPEPSSLALIGLGGLLIARRRRG